MLKIRQIFISLSGGVAFALSSSSHLPVTAEEARSVDDLDIIEINLEDVVQFNWGVQAELQGAGTPNQAGVGLFIPISKSNSNVFFLDSLINANFSDYNIYGNSYLDSSINDTKVAGTTFSTSTRLGTRWLSHDQSWMFGVNAGYDSRTMATGVTINNVEINNPKTAYFSQVGVNIEAVNKKTNTNVYALIPIGRFGYKSRKVAPINRAYGASPLATLGIDMGYMITPSVNIEAGYYYQTNEKDLPDYPSSVGNSGVRAELIYKFSNAISSGIVYSYDNSFKSRISANLKLRFNASGATQKDQGISKNNILDTLSQTPANRTIRVNCSEKATSFNLDADQCGD